MLNLLRFVTLEKYNKQLNLTQYWKQKHDEQLQEHQNTILENEKKYKALKGLFDEAVQELKKFKEKQ